MNGVMRGYLMVRGNREEHFNFGFEACDFFRRGAVFEPVIKRLPISHLVIVVR